MRFAGWTLGIALVAILALIVLPASTVADPSCTDTWTGGAGTTIWQTAENWSTGAIPSSSDAACIGSGVTVQVTGGTNQVGSLQGEGSLTISGGSLELASSTEASSVESLTLSGGALTGGGTLDVSSSLSWSGGTWELTGKVNPNGLATTYDFEYEFGAEDKGTSYGHVTSVQAAGSGTSLKAVDADIEGDGYGFDAGPFGARPLVIICEYVNARLVASSAAGTSYGKDVEFGRCT